MALSDLLVKIKALATNDTVSRVAKTVVEVIAAQTALYTTVVPNPPSTSTAAALAGGAGTVSLLWNLAIKWALASRNKRLVALEAAIVKAAALIVAEQAQAKTQVPQQSPIVLTAALTTTTP